MTISSSTRKAGPFTGNGITTAFPFAYKVFTAADVYVVRTLIATGTESTLVLNTDYTVSLNADQNANPGGTVSMITAPSSAYSITLSSSLEYLQPTDLTNQGGFYPAVITNALDRLTIFCQQLYEQVSRSLKLAISTAAGVNPTLPVPEANALIGWNADADGFQNVDPATMATLVAYGTAQADIFSGTGSQTLFTLTANPGNQANLDISISGVTQRPGVDYFWTSGVGLLFSSAPPAGTNNVLVRYMQGLPTGYGARIDVDLYASLPSVTGSVGDIVYLKQHTANGYGGGQFQFFSGSVTDDGGTQINSVASPGLYLRRVSYNVLTPRMFGAVGDGVSDDTLAITKCLAKQVRIEGENLTYLVTGNITLPAWTWFENATFKQSTPNNANRRTLTQTSGLFLTLRNVAVDRNGTGTGGSLTGAAGIYVSGTSKVRLFDVEVYGNDIGNGIVLVDVVDGVLRDPYVHDIRAGDASAAVMTDDNVQGIWIQRGSKIRIINPRVENLTTQWSGQAAWNRFTRGIIIGGTKDFDIVSPYIYRVDQGIDLSGDENACRFSVLGGSVVEPLTYGFKAANSPQDGAVEGLRVHRAGNTAFICSAPGSALAEMTQNIKFVACNATEVGYGGYWIPLANVCGYRVSSSGATPTIPASIKFIGCSASADGAGMEYGFLNDATISAAGDVWVEAVNCDSVGATIADFAGMHQGFTFLERTAGQTITTGAFTDISWSTATHNRQAAWSAGTPANITILKSGIYMVTVAVEWSGNSNGTRIIRIMRNGSAVKGSRTRIPAVDSNTKNFQSTYAGPFNKNDVLTIQAYQDTGGNLDLTAETTASITLIASGQGT